jgi:hypothetical protein
MVSISLPLPKEPRFFSGFMYGFGENGQSRYLLPVLTPEEL